MDDCLLWPGRTLPNGYGVMYPQHAKTVYVHRLAWEICNGPIPTGLQVDHTCRQRACLNPAHMQLVTPTRHGVLSNVDRWQTIGNGETCRHGHNTYRRTTTGKPYCRECNKLRQRQRRAA